MKDDVGLCPEHRGFLGNGSPYMAQLIAAEHLDRETPIYEIDSEEHWNDMQQQERREEDYE